MNRKSNKNAKQFFCALGYSIIIMLFGACISNQDLKETGHEEKQTNQAKMKTISFPSGDGVHITADLYLAKAKAAPFIILFHQAQSSRGEYILIAPRLNDLGFHCLAVDQRSGNIMNKIENLTAKEANAKGKARDYIDAYPDMEAALLYVKNKLKPEKIFIWGSSYSATLVLILAAQYPELVKGVLSFSPGRSFAFKGRQLVDYAGTIQCPVFITSAKSEIPGWEALYNAIPSKFKIGFIPEKPGRHGSSALFYKPANEEYWKAVEEFLKKALD